MGWVFLEIHDRLFDQPQFSYRGSGPIVYSDEYSQGGNLEQLEGWQFRLGSRDKTGWATEFRLDSHGNYFDTLSHALEDWFLA